VLVNRTWPRGISKKQLAIDEQEPGGRSCLLPPESQKETRPAPVTARRHGLNINLSGQIFKNLSDALVVTGEMLAILLQLALKCKLVIQEFNQRLSGRGTVRVGTLVRTAPNCKPPFTIDRIKPRAPNRYRAFFSMTIV